MAICRNADALMQTMYSSTPYAQGAHDAQMNLTLEFSRRARGIPIWAALRTLGHDGVAALVDQHCEYARYVADRLRAGGLEILNRVQINQVLVRGNTDQDTVRIRDSVIEAGHEWFGPTSWNGRPAFRISISSWRTRRIHLDGLIERILAAAH
jgi:glutamate/tyrosine decarboxylase-like PLP-dependent enzyme